MSNRPKKQKIIVNIPEVDSLSDNSYRQRFSYTKVFSHNLAFYDSSFDHSGGVPPQRYLRYALIIALLIFFMPSLKLVRVQRVISPLLVPTIVQAGLIVTLPDLGGELQSIDIDGNLLEKLPETNLYYAAFDLAEHGIHSVHGLLRQRRLPLETGPLGWLYASPLHAFHIALEVITPTGVNPNIAGPVVNSRQPSSLRSPSVQLHEQEQLKSVMSRKDGLLDFVCWKNPFSKPNISWVLRRRRTHAQNLEWEVQSMGPANVAWAGSLGDGGNTVILYHGDGLYSRFPHLTKINTQTGATLKPGDNFAEVQNTSLAQIPWQISWNGKSLNPDAFLDLSHQLCQETPTSKNRER